MAINSLSLGYSDLRIDSGGDTLNPLVNFPTVGILKVNGVNVDPTTSGGLVLPVLLDKCRIMADGTFLLYNIDQNKFHPLEIRGAAGAEYITIGAGEP